MAQVRKAHIFEKQPEGHYVEPAWCSARLLAVDNFGPRGSLIADPACGWGTILKSARSFGYRVLGGDIVDRDGRDNKLPFYRHDFLNGARLTKGRVMSVVCNPPFDHVQEFCERGLELAHSKVAMIMLLRRLPAAHWLQRLPLETIYLLTPRPSMPPGEWIADGNEPGGGSQDFCWLVFNCFGVRGDPAMRWLHRDGGKK
jgi:hypothetical protein